MRKNLLDFSVIFCGSSSISRVQKSTGVTRSSMHWRANVSLANVNYNLITGFVISFTGAPGSATYWGVINENNGVSGGASGFGWSTSLGTNSISIDMWEATSYDGATGTFSLNIYFI